MDTYSQLDAAWHSDRLTYRAVENNSADRAFFHSIFNDPINTAMGTRVLLKPASSDLFDHLALSWSKNHLLFVVACLRDEPGLPPIGWISLASQGEAVNTFHHRNAVVSLGVATGQKGKGFGGEMINWALDWGFKRANLHRVGLSVSSHNDRAESLYRKLGFVEEGREREVVCFERKWYDCIHFGMLEDEWVKLRTK